ncbi:unnamed protein product [Dicrocoelium dendriticum]|nr:unnamed protein product [Dicrocoelium dendriticum]
MGLRACNKVETLSAKDVYFKHFSFEQHPRYFIRTPTGVSQGYNYMPRDYHTSTSPYPIKPLYEVPQPDIIAPSDPQLPVQLSHSYGIYHHTMNPIFLFLPYIKPVSTSEDVIRMMGHVLLETQLHMTLHTLQDGFQFLGNNEEKWLSANTVKLRFGLYTDTALLFPTFRRYA